MVFVNEDFVHSDAFLFRRQLQLVQHGLGHLQGMDLFDRTSGEVASDVAATAPEVNADIQRTTVGKQILYLMEPFFVTGFKVLRINKWFSALT